MGIVEAVWIYCLRPHFAVATPSAISWVNGLCLTRNGALPVRLNGLGIKDLVALLDVSRVAATLLRGVGLGFPMSVIHPPKDWGTRLSSLRNDLGDTFDPLNRWLQDEHSLTILPVGIEAEHRKQEWWSRHLHKARRLKLAKTSTIRNQCRLALQDMPYTSAWMNVVPSLALGTKLGSAQARALLRWWLGIPLRYGLAMACPCCGDASDVFGDHLASCKLNQPVRRHNALRNALADVLRSNGVSCQLEVAIGGKQRPADVAILNLDPRGPLAVDIVVHHPLALSYGRDPMTTKRALAREEDAKVEKRGLAMSFPRLVVCRHGMASVGWRRTARRSLAPTNREGYCG